MVNAVRLISPEVETPATSPESGEGETRRVVGDDFGLSDGEGVGVVTGDGDGAAVGEGEGLGVGLGVGEGVGVGAT